MTNPNNAIGTNGAFGGRTSVNAFNDNLSAWTRGVMSGWACEPDSGMTVALGGDSSVRDVAVAEDDAGNKTSINNISLAPVQVTIPGAPASNTRIDSIVAYVDNPPQGSATITDNYESCGIIVVSGTATSSPVPPNESTIRSAITADGATGATAYYVVLANVSVANGTTDITSGEIMAGDVAQLSGESIIEAKNIDSASMSAYNMGISEVSPTTGFTDLLSVDISHFPDGAKFLVAFTGSANGTDSVVGYFLRARYGSTFSKDFVQANSWGKNVSGQWVFTKTAGENTIVLQHRKDNNTQVVGYVRTIYCTIVG